MDAVVLRYLPHNTNKVFEQTFKNVKLKAGTYIYTQNDRVKKLCSVLDKNIDTIKVIQMDQFDKSQVFQIIMIDPTQLEIIDMKQKLLNIGMQNFKKRISLYSDYIEQMSATIERLNKKRKRIIKRIQKREQQ